ncbi:M949_RS01915 family surface polysaccharide biosynthesis protein [Massilia eburnea]|uniref:M949_RS01915 family surface polysaccharide biosynthesis protein n=1 Tax=Massilia eburnea TaxID=1776165 RepID=UPI003D6B5508
MRRLATTLTYSVCALLVLACHSGQASDLAATTIPAAEIGRLQVETSGKVVLGKKVSDALGEHILLLTEKSLASQNGRIEHIELVATYYDLADGKWTPAWAIKDGVDCPGLDSAASFFADATTVTDLDKDGKAEVTVAYKTFCGGGVDPSTVKVILRQGKQKFALRGESLIKFKGQEAMGGTNKPDKALLDSDKAVFKRHMDKVWQQVYVERNDG